MADELRRANRVLPAGEWIETTARDTVTLDFDERFRRRRRYTGAKGTDVLLDLEEAIPLRDGDGLMLEGGGVILVRAAPEPLSQITAATPELLMRLAWHLGNRHLPTQIEGTRILIREDHVITAMLRGLGATVEAVLVPFNPEGGAYGGHGHSHGHGHHHHDHDHHHDH